LEQGKRAQPALKVADIEEALTFYGRLFEFKLRGKTSAFIDLGDGRRARSRRGRRDPDPLKPV
jgi:lactoylglutathione lyase